MSKHGGERKKRTPKKRNRKLVVLGISVTPTDALGNVFGRIHRKGELFHKTRKPGAP